MLAFAAQICCANLPVLIFLCVRVVKRHDFLGRRRRRLSLDSIYEVSVYYNKIVKHICIAVGHKVKHRNFHPKVRSLVLGSVNEICP